MSTSIFVSGLLRGKSALVTGGGSGIGAGIAKRLAEQGARVALVGRTLEKLESIAQEIRKAGGEASTHPCDVREYAKVEDVVNAAAALHGGLDVIVNSAAGNFLAPAATLSANGFRSVVDIDLCGTFNVSRAAFAHLEKSRGLIINVTATQASVPTPLQCHAGAAKAGIEKLTRDLALEWGRFGIRVNAIAPGPIDDTEGMKRLAPADAETKLKKRVPLERWGSIFEICEAVTFLVSPSATYMTGSTMLVDGGTSLLGGGAFFEAFG